MRQHLNIYKVFLIQILIKLLQSLIVTKFNYDDLLVGDKNSILIAARVLGYGKDYTFNYSGEEITVDLSELPFNELNSDLIEEKGNNSFMFEELNLLLDFVTFYTKVCIRIRK